MAMRKNQDERGGVYLSIAENGTRQRDLLPLAVREVWPKRFLLLYTL